MGSRGPIMPYYTRPKFDQIPQDPIRPHKTIPDPTRPYQTNYNQIRPHLLHNIPHQTRLYHSRPDQTRSDHSRRDCFRPDQTTLWMQGKGKDHRQDLPKYSLLFWPALHTAPSLLGGTLRRTYRGFHSFRSSIGRNQLPGVYRLFDSPIPDPWYLNPRAKNLDFNVNNKQSKQILIINSD